MDASWWWLRSPGNNDNNAANVNTDGSLNENGNNVNNENGVRPALSDQPVVRFKAERTRARIKEPNSFRKENIQVMAEHTCHTFTLA